MSSPHDGHRSRMKSRYKVTGLNGFSQHEKLEMLLFYTHPRGDVNPLAHRLIDRYQTLTNVFNAPFEELEKIDGIGEHSAVLLKLIPDLCREYMVESGCCNQTKLITSDDVINYMKYRFIGIPDEVLYAVYMDDSCKVLRCEQISSGNVSAVNVNIRKLTEIALTCNATAVVIAHNHPGGVPHPSSDDLESTVKLTETFGHLNIRLLDHIIVSGNQCVSMRQSEQYCYVFESEKVLNHS